MANLKKDFVKSNASDLKTQLLLIIRGNHPAKELKDLLEDYHESDIASVFSYLHENERKRLYVVLNTQTLAEIFSYIEDPTPFIDELEKQKLVNIVENMSSGDAVELLDNLEEEEQEELLSLVDEQTAKEVKLILTYPEEQVGSVMTNDFASINCFCTVKQAMREVIEQASEVKNITTLFVTEQNGKFYGAIRLRDLVIARSTTPLADIIISEFPFLYASDEKEAVLDKIKNYCEELLPVLDADNRLIGALTSADVLEAVQEEMQEDYAKLAGLSQEEELKESVFKSVFKRLPWLISLFGLSFLVSAMIGIFDTVIALLPLVVFFQPMILGMSGNSATQSLGVTVRSLSDQISGKSAFKLIFKEVRVCFLNGLLLSFIAVLVLSGYMILLKGEPLTTALTISSCISVSLLISITFSGFFGSSIPLFFKRIGIDPATASGPFITTLNDLISALTYYGLATLLLL